MSPREQATFEAGELAVVLSHYDLGVIESVTDFPRGSRRSPKVGLVCQRGKFLLKRRSFERAHPERVAFTHRVQKHLIAAGFPIPRLVPTSDTGRDLLQIRDYVYELFEFIPGHAYGQTNPEAQDAGVVLARFHQCTEDFEVPANLPTPRGHYHNAPGVRTGLHAIGSTLSSHDSFSGDEAELASLVQHLLSAYDAAAEPVNHGGFSELGEGVIHSDWHPGNLLFRDQRVVAVIDHDTLRLARRILDVANGALQFSMLAGGDPATWPDHLDEDRFRAFLAGYESIAALTNEERSFIPCLMTEALIAECVPPITETGSVGRWAGYRVLRMIRRKIGWMAKNGPRLMDEYHPRP